MAIVAVLKTRRNLWIYEYANRTAKFLFCTRKFSRKLYPPPTDYANSGMDLIDCAKANSNK